MRHQYPFFTSAMAWLNERGHTVRVYGRLREPWEQCPADPENYYVELTNHPSYREDGKL